MIVPDETIVSSTSIVERLRTTTAADPALSLRLTDPGEHHITADGLVYTAEGRCIVPNNANLRRDILRQSHDTEFAGHFGVNKTAKLVKRYWVETSSHILNTVPHVKPILHRPFLPPDYCNPSMCPIVDGVL